ncbi:MAG TPA: hypothetical protein PLX33_05170, partial [Alphaproteobacteria bacterium]|nr:hypothetical protein [Alphaproteobacteria bacterium]
KRVNCNRFREFESHPLRHFILSSTHPHQKTAGAPVKQKRLEKKADHYSGRPFITLGSQLHLRTIARAHRLKINFLFYRLFLTGHRHFTKVFAAASSLQSHLVSPFFSLRKA